MIAPLLIMQFSPITAPALMITPGITTVPRPMLAEGETKAAGWTRTAGTSPYSKALWKHRDRVRLSPTAADEWAIAKRQAGFSWVVVQERNAVEITYTASNVENDLTVSSGAPD
jgi:hypothetical protein